jgi:hypothetical protein|tara:strand:- start:11169 stop:11975 length:807 start_codon:yes stop_codon:yes gene_type:complete
MAVKETLSYSDGVKGWPSFYSFLPDFMIGMNSYLYTFNGGNLYRHNTNALRNNYYGVQYNSNITSVFNVEPQTIKLFKTMSFESDDAWAVTSLSTELSVGNMLQTYFEEKEAEWFSFIRNDAKEVNFKLRSTNGIGIATAVVPTFGIPPFTPRQITFLNGAGTIISIGDELYQSEVDPVTGNVLAGTSELIGLVSSVNSGTSVNTVSVGQTSVLTNTPIAGRYMFFYKNVVAESHGARGYYMRFTLQNTNTAAVELFSVGSSVMKSYP